MIFSHVLYQLSYLGAEARRSGGLRESARFIKGRFCRDKADSAARPELGPAAAQSLRRSSLAGSAPSESSSDSTAGIA